MHADEFARVTLGPARQLDVVHLTLLAEAEAVPVLQKLGKVVELGRELLDVRAVVQTVVPGLRDRGEHARLVVEGAALEAQKVAGERLQSYQIVEHRADTRVQRAIVKLGHVRVVERLVAVQDLGQSLRIEGTDRSREVAVHAHVAQIQPLRGVVAEHPRKHRILIQIVVGTSGRRVQVHQILKVAETPLPPQLGRMRALRLTEQPAERATPPQRRRVHAAQGAFHLSALTLREEVQKVGTLVVHVQLQRSVLQQKAALPHRT
mmetsp:Transcript_3674/g.8890  ORF Transcript_3674/g.8890 Transcript_3674/m.8890 type:complete len:263 (-) Transcript_3674:1312-2100(-)